MATKISNVLVTFRADYADEFDVYGFKLTTEIQWNHDLENARKYFEKHGSWEAYFGTNEAIEVDSFEDYKKNYKVTPISIRDRNGIAKNFACFRWGHFLEIDEDMGC